MRIFLKKKNRFWKNVKNKFIQSMLYWLLHILSIYRGKLEKIFVQSKALLSVRDPPMKTNNNRKESSLVSCMEQNFPAEWIQRVANRFCHCHEGACLVLLLWNSGRFARSEIFKSVNCLSISIILFRLRFSKNPLFISSNDASEKRRCFV